MRLVAENTAYPIISRRHLSVLLLIASALVGCGAPASKEAEDPQHLVGKTIYRQYCFSCHSSGINSAPRMGDAEAWDLLREKGDAELLRTTKEGIHPFMPKMGLCVTCSDEELVAAIDYMMRESVNVESG